MKQSVDLMNSMKRFSFRHSNTGTVAPTNLARRVMLLLSILLMSVGNVWGETKEIHKYIKWDQTSAVFNVSDAYTQLGISLSVLKAAHRIDWYVLNEISVKQSLSYGDSQKTGVWTFFIHQGHTFWPYTGENSNTSIYLDNNANYWSQGDLESGWTSWNLSKPIIYAPSGGTFETYKDYTVVCEVSAETSPSEVGVRYVFHFNETGIEPDDFIGTFSGAETPLSHEVASRTTSATTTIDMSGVLSTLPSAKYARFYLEKNGEAQAISSTAITFANSQTTDKASRGAYLYTGFTLTISDLSAITINLPAGTYEDYQLIAVFSDDAPRAATGTTVTQEPADLDVKYVYNFTYPVTVIDKYIKWDTNQTSLDISDYLVTDLPSLTSSSTKGYIGWSVLDNSSTPVTMIADHYSSHTQWSFSNSGAQFSPYGTGYTGTVFSISDSQISGNFTTFTKPRVNAPNADTFETYGDYTIVCNVSDESSSNIQVRYVFHFNATGKKPDTFSGALKSGAPELAGGAVVGQPDAIAKSVENATLNFTNALAAASGATYVRFYLKKDGEAVSRTGKLSVTGGTEGPEVEHGYYIYKSGGLTATDVDDEVSLTLGAGEFEDYQVVAVFGDGEPSGTPLKEVDLDLQYTYAFEYPFKGDASSATVVEKTFSISESKKTQTLTMAYDIANNKITLKDGSDNTIGEVNVDASTFWSAYGSALSGSQPFYVRWFLQDKSGVEATSLASAGAIVDGGSSLYAVPEKAGYGLYFSTDNGTQALNNIMTIKVVGAKVTDLAQYNLVCTIATDLTGEAFDGVGGTLSHEPNTLLLKYVLKFEDAEWAGTLDVSAFKHSKEILLANESVASVAIPFGEEISKIKAEFGEANFKDGLADHLHVRYFITKKQGSTYEIIPNSEDYLANAETYWQHKTKTGLGLYWNSEVSQKPGDDSDASKIMNITFTKPDPSADWEDYKLVIWLSNDLSSQAVAGGVLEKEPTPLNMQYMYSFFTEDAFQFVHDKGESGRDYYTQTDFTDAVQQYNWDNANSTKESVSEKIRQSVHTVEYDLYVDPTSTTPVELHLPFQKYSSTGDPLEPAAYIRWYDWKSDVKGNRLTGIGTLLEEGSEMNGGISVNRGLFFLNNSKKGVKPISSSIGATFNPNGLDELVTIACDVSKYYDGIYESSVMDTRSGFEACKKPYLMHEPTLSTRYLFNIRPASVIATAIKIGKTNFEGVDIDSKFKLGEDNGRVCVQYNSSKTTEFSVRASLPTLDDYFFYDTDNTTIIQGAKIKWVPYYVDGTGKVWEWNDYQSVNSNRIQHISVASLTNTSTTSGYKNGSEYTAVTVGDGSIIHLVGYIYNSDESKNAPVIHYELFFRDAPAYQVTDLPSHMERTEAYLSEHMTLQDVVNFDDDGNDCGLGVTATIGSQLDNHSTMPLAWDKAQYGFCYPDVRRIPVSNDDLNGISPIHGDYMILKSMNKVGISENDATHIYKYHWYRGTPELTDYTNTMGGQFGNFLYVDASDESRTIAKMKFTANLCAGSELCFTGAIADMTGGSGYIWPEVMATVYAVKKTTKKRVRVVSFHSSDLSTVADGVYSQGKWYQMYGSVPIPNNVDLTDIESYEVEIDNYALGTSGADYCVDQLMFYTSTGKMTVEQTGGMCLDEDLALTASMTAELLEHKIPTLSSTPTKIYYRVFKRTSAEGVTPVTYEPYDDSSIYNNGGKDYGETTACKAVLNSDGSLDNSTVEKTEQNKGYYIEKGVLRFKVIDNKVFNLPQGDYFFALTNVLPFTGTPTTALSDWANPNDACDVFSNFFVPRKMAVDFTSGGSPVSNVIGAGCGGGTPIVTGYQLILKVPDVSEASGFKTYNSETEGITFTFYKGATAAEALTNAQSGTSSISSGTSTFTYSGLTSGTNYFVAVPSTTTLSDSKTICGYIPFSFVVANAGPNLVLGFSDVTYPDGYERVVRIGMEQLKNLESGYTLHIPVQSFKDKNGNTANDILMENYFTLYGTTDPLIAKASGKDYEVDVTTTKVAEFVDTKSSKPIVNADYMYLPLNFANNAVDFHEGYEYKIHTTFCDVNDESDVSACHPDLYLIIKVVPEFVTWNGTTTNVNWNNDNNWGRSSRAELYKSADDSQNTATTAQGGAYKNNAEIHAALSTVPQTYVPMKFTYVTLNEEAAAPKLADLAVISGEVYNGGSMYSGSLTVDGSAATDNIQYDMLVRYTEKTCQGHMNSSSIVEGAGTGNVYDCEKFYGNICKEIYFKPDMELLNQQYLTYEKAWVEKELTSNTWYLMSTPLRDTYAGDMFVPLSATATKNGRQETEAFQAITFPDQADATYSRTKYPFYQHSWGNTFGSTVRVASNDNYRTDYSAKLQSLAVTETAFANWGHSFNDVQEPYTTRTAFAIRAHKKTQGTAALIRLPKTNTTYNYFDWRKDTNPTVDPKTSGVKTVTKDGYGKLLVDKDQNATQFDSKWMWLPFSLLMAMYWWVIPIWLP